MIEMIARFDGRFRLTAPHLRKKTTPRRPPSARSRKVISWMTGLFLIWILYRAIFSPEWVAQLPPIAAELLSLLELGWCATLFCLWFLIWKHSQPTKPAQISNQVKALNIDELYALSPADFEAYVARLFRRKGYRVELRGRSGDNGVDLMVTNRRGLKAVVQCKRYRNNVGPDTIRELYGTLVHEQVAHAFLVTTAGISRSAKKWAKGKPMTLIDGDELARLAGLLGDHVH